MKAVLQRPYDRVFIREAALQSAIVDYLRAVAPDVLVFAVPNSSRRTMTGRASNAVAGLLPGIPDLALVLPDGRAAFIECKTAKGVLSPPQQAMRFRLIRMGIPCCVCRSIQDVEAALAQWGVKTRGRIAA